MGGLALGRWSRIALAVLLIMAVGVARAQELTERDVDLADRPVGIVRIVGASADDERLIRNNLRVAVGDPYDAPTVRDDVSRVYALGRFRYVTAEAALAEDGSVTVTYSIAEQPLILEIQVVGNNAVSDQELLAGVPLRRNMARDDFLIERATRDIAAIYRKKGYYLTEVSVDDKELEQQGILIFNIVEGPRVRVKAIEFEGANAFPAKRLRREVKSRTHILLIRPGVLDEDVLVSDEAALDRFYRDRGYLDVRVGHRTDLSPDNKEAKITFVVAEGRLYTLGSVRVDNLEDPGRPLKIFSAAQISALLAIKRGDVYSRDKVLKSVETLEQSYGNLGFIDARVVPSELRSGPEPVVDLFLEISEGRLYKVGAVNIQDNFLTKDKVIRREIKLRPGRPYDTTQLEESRRRLRNTRLFNDVRITVQDPDPVEPEYRDLLVELKELNTGSINFGVAVGSDSGIFGDFSLVQNNFDIADLPESPGELFTGRAFRGAGQRFRLNFRPGDELFQYSGTLTEPRLFETDTAGTIAGVYRKREYEDYDEKRTSISFSLSRQLGDIWSIGVTSRVERVELTDIQSDAPVDVFADRGPDDLTSFGVTLARTTLGSFTRPSEGTRLELELERIGLLGGDFDFFRAQGEYTIFFTLDEDFLGRKSILKLTSRSAYIFGEDGRVPTYERFYLGGRSFRGFEFRTISPKGVRADTGEVGDDPVGGKWLLFFGAQYEFPLFEQVVAGVVFVDSGTVTNSVGFDEYRVSAGVGVRLYIEQLGPVPIAFDFGFPIVKQDGDEEQLLSFSAELPF